MADLIQSTDPGMPAEDNHGRAAYGPGSTTQGGSNFGQGSSHLGGTGYNKQGAEASRGSNYDNEADSLGASTTGTSNEGAQNPQSGAAQEAPFDAEQEARQASTNTPAPEPVKRRNLGAEDNLGA